MNCQLPVLQQLLQLLLVAAGPWGARPGCPEGDQSPAAHDAAPAARGRGHPGAPRRQRPLSGASTWAGVRVTGRLVPPRCTPHRWGTPTPLARSEHPRATKPRRCGKGSAPGRRGEMWRRSPAAGKDGARAGVWERFGSFHSSSP